MKLKIIIKKIIKKIITKINYMNNSKLQKFFEYYLISLLLQRDIIIQYNI